MLNLAPCKLMLLPVSYNNLNPVNLQVTLNAEKVKKGTHRPQHRHVHTGRRERLSTPFPASDIGSPHDDISQTTPTWILRTLPFYLMPEKS